MNIREDILTQDMWNIDQDKTITQATKQSSKDLKGFKQYKECFLTTKESNQKLKQKYLKILPKYFETK